MRANNVGYKVFKAAKKNQLQLLKSLCAPENDPPYIYRDFEHQNALHWAILNHNSEACFELVKAAPALLHDARRGDDATPLVLAARGDHWDCLQSMLRGMAVQEVDEESSDLTYAGAALIIAVKKRQLSAAHALLKAHAPKEQTDFPAGRTPLLCAINNNDAEMVRLLLQHDASDDIKDTRGDTPLTLAMKRGHWRCVVTLCENGKTFSEEIVNQALLQAVKEKQYRAADALLHYARADANFVDEGSDTRTTLLHLAVINEQPEMAALLVKYGAKFDGAFDSNGDTPLHLAVKTISFNMIDWCISLGATKAIQSRANVPVARLAVTVAGGLAEPERANHLTQAVNESTSHIEAAVVAIAKGDSDMLQSALESCHDVNARIAPGNLSLLEYAVTLERVGMMAPLLQKSSHEIKDSAFQLACIKSLWSSAEAIDKVGGLVAALDAKYYHQLSWHRLDNKRVKQRFMSELNMKVSELDDKKEYLEKAAETKTACYRQLLFWKKEPTHTTEQLIRASTMSMST